LAQKPLILTSGVPIIRILFYGRDYIKRRVPRQPW
jgi:hypothetical protein